MEKSWISLLFSFYLIREGMRAVNLWTPALHTCIPYGHLGNLWMASFHSAGLSHPSTLLIEKIAFNRKNRVFVNVEMKNLMIFSYFLLSIELWTEQTLFLKIDKISKAGCKKRGLMQYKCMEKEIRKLHGRILLLSVIIYREYSGRNAALTERNHESLYTGSRFSPPAPRRRGSETDSADS